jgi:hypothetical protein
MFATLSVTFLLDPIHALPQRLHLGICFGFQRLALNTRGPFGDSLRFQRLSPVIQGPIQPFSMRFGLFPAFRCKNACPMGFLTGRLSETLCIRTTVVDVQTKGK